MQKNYYRYNRMIWLILTLLYFLAFAFIFSFFPRWARAACSDGCEQVIIDWVIETYDTTDTCLQGNCLTGDYIHYSVMGVFYGTDGYNQAQAAAGSGSVQNNKGSICGCSNAYAGYFSKVVYNQSTDFPHPNNPSTICPQIHREVHIWVWVRDGGEDCFRIVDSASCSPYSLNPGSIVGSRYQKCNCTTGEDIGTSTKVIGNIAEYNKISNGQSPGIVGLFPNSACTLKWGDLVQINDLGGNTRSCSLPDTDGDGVPDQDDYCETPSNEIDNVDSIGCTKQGGSDNDGDGIPDNFDACDSPPGATVGPDGCSIEMDDKDTDRDGVNDNEDSCPFDGSGIIDGAGCPIDNSDQPQNGEGDQDNDNALLAGIISHLKGMGGTLKGIKQDTGAIEESTNNIEDDVDTIAANTNDIKSKLDDTNDKLDDVNNNLNDQKAIQNDILAEVGNVLTTAENIDQGVNDLNTLGTATNEKLDTANTNLENNLDALNTLADITTDGFTNIEEELTGIGSGIDGVENSMAGLGAGIDGVKNEVDIANGKLAGIESGIGTLNGTANGIKASVDDGFAGLQGSVDGLADSMAGLEGLGEIEGLGELAESLEGLAGLGDAIDGVNQNLEDIKEELETDEIDTSLPETDDPDAELPEDFQPYDMDDEGQGWADTLESLAADNPISQMITGSELETSGDCSISANCTLMGQSTTLEFSMCDYDLSVFRVMLLMITSLTCFFIVFRRGA